MAVFDPRYVESDDVLDLERAENYLFVRSLKDEAPLIDFERASKEVLEFLYARIPFGLWMVTRTRGNDWIILTAEDHHYGVGPGDLFKWSDTFCSQMVQGHGPVVAPRSDEIPAYASAPIGKQIAIGAYIGVPLMSDTGELFGTLCAIDPDQQPDAIEAEASLVRTMAHLLSGVLKAELKSVDLERRAMRAEAQSSTDALTGLANRRAFDTMLAAEETRTRRYGQPAVVLTVDLDGLKEVNDTRGHVAGDRLLRSAADAIASSIRESDFAARVGGDEFAVLALDTNLAESAPLVGRLRQALSAAGVQASIGAAQGDADTPLSEALQRADQAMYAEKSGKGGAPPPIKGAAS